MKKRNKKYWLDRAVQLEKAIQAEATPAVENIKRTYESAIRNINADMRKTFREFARASGITEEEAAKLINASESKELYRDFVRLYDETEDVQTRKDIAIKINRQAYGARMSRLEALKERVYIRLKQAQNAETAQHKALHPETLKRSYYSNIYNISKGFNIGINFAVLPQKAIDKALSAKWLGSNYSERIWNNNEQFIEKVRQTIIDGITAGHSISRMSEQLLDYVAVENKGQRYIVERLARSETAHFMAEGQLEAYKEAGIEKYQFVAALSERTCDTCGGLDGETFDVSQARAGDNYPPIHANCRCTTVLAGYPSAARIARDLLTGKNYKVDGSMTFSEWKNSLSDEQKAALKYVDKSVGNGIISMRGGKSVLKVNTGGRRNEKALTGAEINSAIDYAVELGMPKEKIYYVDYDCTAYGTAFDLLRIGTDVYPAEEKQKNPNGNVSMKGAIAHEIVGHRNAALTGHSQSNELLEEVQASIRAAKLAPGLSTSERMMLVRDGLYRLHMNGQKLKDIKHMLYLEV